MARSFTRTSSQYLNNDNAVVSSTPLTMAIWCYSTSATSANTKRLMTIGRAGLADDIYSLFYNGGNTSLEAQQYDGTTAGTISISNTDDQWNHFCCVFTSDSSRTGYLNGGSETTDSTSVTALASLDYTAIGALRWSSTMHYWDGYLAEAAIWNAALAGDEVATLASGYSALFVRPASLVAYWPLIGRTSPEIDIVGGYNMTLNAGPTTARHPKVFYPSVTLNPQQPVSSVLAHYQKIKVVSTLPDTSDVIPGGAQGILVQGQIADDEISAGNPIQTAGEAKAADGTDPGSVVESDNATIITDLNRSQLINTSHPNFWEQTENWTDSQTNNQLEVNPGAGLSLYVESANVSAGTPMEIEFVEDTAGAGTVILGPYYLPANGQLSYTFSPPIKVTENVNFGFTSRVGGDDNPHTVSATGYIGPT